MLSGERHERVHAVGVDGHADIGKHLEEERRGRLYRVRALESVEVVGVPRAPAVSERGGHETHILAGTLVGLVVVDPRELGQLGVHRVDVVEVDEILGDQLPITLDGVFLLPGMLKIGHVVARQLLRQVPEALQERHRVRRLVQEDYAREGLQAGHRLQAEQILALLGRSGRWCGLQCAIQSVRPPMVWADQLLATLFVFGGDSRTSVAADVVEGMDLRVLVARHDDRSAPHLDDLHIPRCRQLRRVRGRKPMHAEDPLPLRLDVLVVDVEGRVQGLGGLDGSNRHIAQLLHERRQEGELLRWT
mmetsp:Transcript_71359/g.188319  ORF Transcript_71359/g.188319 Transcript_71359/m.188319 type:complete len:304 (-) Transcript_71359:194-1105(-)